MSLCLSVSLYLSHTVSLSISVFLCLSVSLHLSLSLYRFFLFSIYDTIYICIYIYIYDIFPQLHQFDSFSKFDLFSLFIISFFSALLFALHPMYFHCTFMITPFIVSLYMHMCTHTKHTHTLYVALKSPTNPPLQTLLFSVVYTLCTLTTLLL